MNQNQTNKHMTTKNLSLDRNFFFQSKKKKAFKKKKRGGRYFRLVRSKKAAQRRRDRTHENKNTNAFF